MTFPNPCNRCPHENSESDAEEWPRQGYSTEGEFRPRGPPADYPPRRSSPVEMTSLPRPPPLAITYRPREMTYTQRRETTPPPLRSSLYDEEVMVSPRPPPPRSPSSSTGSNSTASWTGYRKGIWEGRRPEPRPQFPPRTHQPRRRGNWRHNIIGVSSDEDEEMVRISPPTAPRRPRREVSRDRNSDGEEVDIVIIAPRGPRRSRR